MINRSRFDILADMVEATSPPRGAKVTHILGRANLSYVIMQRYLTCLLKSELVEKEDNMYYSTEKGRDFVKRLRELRSKLSYEV